jgi:ELWxxDGT repeat protein
LTTRNSILAALLAVLLGAVPGAAQTASLVADLVASDEPGLGSSPDNFTPVRGGRIVFTAGESSTGRELWGSDGTAEGTVLLTDARPGPDSGTFTFLGTLDGVALIAGDLSARMWRSDGTREGTFPLRDGDGGAPLEDRYGEAAIAFGGRVYFGACGTVHGCGLWSTDGTQAGTHLFVGHGRMDGPALRFAATERTLFFAVYQFASRTGLLFSTDGTAAGTVRLGEFGDFPRSLTPVGDRLYFVGVGYNEQELWVSDGTRAGTRPVTDFHPSLPFGGGLRNVGEPLLFADAGRIDFAVHDGVHGWEVWQSDGTREGTRLMTDFADWFPFLNQNTVSLAKVGGRLLVPVLSSNYRWSLWASDGRSMVRLHACLGGCRSPLAEPAKPPALVEYGDQVLFTAGAGAGQELWSTDGTARGTHKLLDACTEACHAVIGLTATTFDGLAVFRISEHGKDQLWGTDGTAAGTHLLFHLPPGTSTGALPVAMGAKVFFGAADEDGMELWVSEDGAERQVANLAAEENYFSAPTSLVVVGSHLVFQTGPYDYRTDYQKGSLWQSEGTAASTSRLLDPFRLPPGCYFGSCAESMATADGWLAFVNTPRNEVSELWRTDGTAEGTFRLATIEAPGRIEHVAAFQGTAVAFVEYPHRLDVWRSDGTPAGTVRIASQAGRMRVLNAGGTGTEVYFQVSRMRSLDLWRSDGTAEGTVQVARLPQVLGLDWDLPETPPVRLGDRVCFATFKPRGSEEMWCTDGTQEGTVKLLDAQQFSGRAWKVIDRNLYVVAYGGFGHGLWRTDGTPGGTVRLHSWGSVPTELTVFAGRLFFAAGEYFEDELWASDGTRAGTGPVLDINPDGGSHPGSFAVFGDRLYFSAFDPEHGFELWQSDGTAGGTRLYQELAPGLLSSSPNRLTVAGDRLYFTAYDRATGNELWSLHDPE